MDNKSKTACKAFNKKGRQPARHASRLNADGLLMAASLQVQQQVWCFLFVSVCLFVQVTLWQIVILVTDFVIKKVSYLVLLQVLNMAFGVC